MKAIRGGKKKSAMSKMPKVGKSPLKQKPAIRGSKRMAKAGRR